VVVNANQTVDNYWVTAPATVRTSTNNTNCGSSVDLGYNFLIYAPVLVDPDTVYAVLHYDGADDADPTSDPPTASGTELLEYNMGSSVSCLFFPRLANTLTSPSRERRYHRNWGRGPSLQYLIWRFHRFLRPFLGNQRCRILASHSSDSPQDPDRSD
jgi:hypothetical protein